MPEALSRSARQAFANADVCVDLCRALCGVYEEFSLLPKASSVVHTALESVKRCALAAYAAQSSAFILDSLSKQQKTTGFFHDAFVRSLGQSLERCAKMALAHVAARQTLVTSVLDACVSSAVAEDTTACLKLQEKACKIYTPDVVVAETLRLQLAAVVNEVTLLSGDIPFGSATPRFLSADAQQKYGNDGKAPDEVGFDKLCVALLSDALSAAVTASRGSTPAIVRLVREAWDYAVPTLLADLGSALRAVLSQVDPPMWTRQNISLVGGMLACTVRKELSTMLSELVAIAGTAGAFNAFASTGLKRLVDLLSVQSFTVLGGVLAEAQRPLLESVAFWAPMAVQSFAAELRRPRYVRMPAGAGRRAGWLRRLRDVVTSYSVLDFEAKANLLFGHCNFSGAVAAFAEQLLAVALTPHRVTTWALCRPFATALASDAGALAQMQGALLKSAGPLWDRLRDAALGDGGPLWPALSLWSGCLRAATLQWDHGFGLECGLIAQFEKLPAFVAPRAQTAAVRALVVGLLELKDRMEAARPHCLTRILVWFLAEVEHLRDDEEDSSATLAELAGQLLRRVDALAADPLWVASSGFSVQAELFRCVADAYVGPLLRAALVDAPELLWESLGASDMSEEDTVVSSVVLTALKRAVTVAFLPANLAHSFDEFDTCAERLAASVAEAEGQHSIVVAFARNAASLLGPLADLYSADSDAFDDAMLRVHKMLENRLQRSGQLLSTCKLGVPARVLLKDLMEALLLSPLESAFRRTSDRGLMMFLRSAAPLLERFVDHSLG
eukprot:m51a1_g12811 hypothetical protein (787) ;mRNA; r:329-3338